MLLPEDRSRKLITRLFRAQVEGSPSALHPSTQAVLTYALTADFLQVQGAGKACTAIEPRRKRGLVSFKKFNH